MSYRMFVLTVIAITAVNGSLTRAAIIRVEDTTLQANTAGQIVRILGSYEGPPALAALDGVNFSVLLGRGGPDLGLPGNITGPAITGINLKPVGGVLSGFTSAQNEIDLGGLTQIVQADLLRADADVPITGAFTDQLLAELIVDTTGFASGTFQVALQDSDLGVTSTFLGGVGGSLPTTLQSGSLTISAVPEPGTVGLLACTSCILVGARVRRRWSRREST